MSCDKQLCTLKQYNNLTAKATSTYPLVYNPLFTDRRIRTNLKFPNGENDIAAVGRFTSGTATVGDSVDILTIDPKSKKNTEPFSIKTGTISAIQIVNVTPGGNPSDFPAIPQSSTSGSNGYPSYIAISGVLQNEIDKSKFIVEKDYKTDYIVTNKITMLTSDKNLEDIYTKTQLANIVNDSTQQIIIKVTDDSAIDSLTKIIDNKTGKLVSVRKSSQPTFTYLDLLTDEPILVKLGATIDVTIYSKEPNQQFYGIVVGADSKVKLSSKFLKDLFFDRFKSF